MLSYIWIKDYGIIKEQGFNFDNKFTFRYTKEDKTFSIRKNEQYIENFYDSEGRIKNVTGVIGANGAGKTTLLNYIKSLSHIEIFSVMRNR